MRHLGSTLATAAAVAVLAAPAAHAAADYVVTLAPAPGTTCEVTIAAVTADYGVRATSTYTSSLCGFAASLSKSQVRSLQNDPRIVVVQPDQGFVAG